MFDNKITHPIKFALLLSGFLLLMVKPTFAEEKPPFEFSFWKSNDPDLIVMRMDLTTAKPVATSRLDLEVIPPANEPPENDVEQELVAVATLEVEMPELEANSNIQYFWVFENIDVPWVLVTYRRIIKNAAGIQILPDSTRQEAFFNSLEIQPVEEGDSENLNWNKYQVDYCWHTPDSVTPCNLAKGSIGIPAMGTLLTLLFVLLVVGWFGAARFQLQKSHTITQ